MRIQCDVCEKNLASVMCCADEAALCSQCDLRVHAANKLANKHQRVHLYPPGEDHPVCDICQEKSAFFFCQEDRALLCRDCDVSIHSANTLSEKHRRFLVTGTRVSLEPAGYDQADDGNDISQTVPSQEPMTSDDKFSHLSHLKSLAGSKHGYSSMMQSTSGVASSSHLRDPNPYSSQLNYDRRDTYVESGSDWKVDELLNIPDLADGYSLADVGSSKAEVDANLGDFDWTADLSLFDEQVYAESLHEVPSLPEPPGRNALSSGKAKAKHDTPAVVPEFEDEFLVPDLGLDAAPPSKKRRNVL